ncbi:MAG: DUF58 domain-containing protein [Planctomycetota bacterium]|jgi:uncharacterized protein (DUF58 family)
MNEAFRRYLLEGQHAGTRYGVGTPHSVRQGFVGSQLGNRSGSSLEFMDHREYIPGDDLRRIDWNAFARSDKLSIKLFRDEVNPHVDIVIDCSRSMALPDSQKARATLGLAAVFAQAAANCDYTFTAWQAGDTCKKVINGTDQPILWEDVNFDGRVSCDESFRRELPNWRPRGIRVLLSDLFWMGEPNTTLSVLGDRASNVFVIQVLSQADLNPPQRGNVRLQDCETGQTKDMFVDAVAEKRYRQNLAHHQYNWSRGCRQFGALMTSVIAEQTVQEWKLDELVLAEVLRVL